VSRYTFPHGKLSHQIGLHAATYRGICAKSGMSVASTVACTVPRQVRATST